MKLFVTQRLYILLVALILCFLMGYFIPVIYTVAQPLALVFFLLVGADIILLYGLGGTVVAERKNKERFSNGDDNEVVLEVKNTYPFQIDGTLLDELPVQFQIRDYNMPIILSPGNTITKSYSLKPVSRGIYAFGNINILVSSPLNLIRRRIIASAQKEVKVYPSFIKLQQYELMALSQRLFMHGQKPVRKVGNSQEFDTIRDYVAGDDPRHINWSATARRGHIMTNHYIDERSQNIYCIIDKSRPMKMPFGGMTLLDYAINASLVIAEVALKKGDKAGLLTFEDKIDVFIKASNRNKQVHQLMEGLYQQKTTFKEPDLAAVYTFLKKQVNQRSLLLLFTNFESIHSLNRQLKHLQMINRENLLMVIYFRNTAVDQLIKENASSTRDIYNQAIAYQMLDEKLQIKDALHRAGILSLYTTPENLNVGVINKYIEVKTKRLL